MEALFTARLQHQGRELEYEVVFDRETYLFLPGETAGERIAIRRQADSWQAEGPVDAGLRSQAEAALDRYLLSQH